jgi:hypothetical protein
MRNINSLFYNPVSGDNESSVKAKRNEQERATVTIELATRGSRDCGHES